MMNVQFNDSDIYVSDLHCVLSKGYSTLTVIIIIIILITINIHCVKLARIRVFTDPYFPV